MKDRTIDVVKLKIGMRTKKLQKTAGNRDKT